MIPCSPEFFKALYSPTRQLYLKIEFYDSKMNYIDKFTQKVTSDIGKISISTTRPSRRSLTLNFANINNLFDWGENNNLIWLDKRIKVYIGLKLRNGEIKYIPQGVYCLNEPFDSHNSEGKKAGITLNDKAFLLTDKRGKFVNQLTIESGTNVAQAIKLIAEGAGETMFLFDDIGDIKTAYEFTYDGNDNRWKAIEELASYGRCEVYYDVNGYLRLKKLPENIDKEPVVFEYKLGDLLYAGNVRSMDEENLANHIRVVGGNSQSVSVTYDLIVDDNITYTMTVPSTTSKLFNEGVKNNLIIDELNHITIQKQGTDFIKKETLKNDFITGTLTNVTATEDGDLILNENQLNGERLSPIIDLSTVNISSKSMITWTVSVPVKTTFKVQTNLSLDGGVTWQGWKDVTRNGEITGITKGTILSNARLQYKQIFSKSDSSAKTPELNEFRIEIYSAYKTGDCIYTSPVFSFPATPTGTNKLFLGWYGDKPTNTNIKVEINKSNDNGVTWSGWQNTNNGDELFFVTPSLKLDELKFQTRLTLSTIDVEFTPKVYSISINADIPNFWNGNPYTVSKIGKISYLHNNGNPDSLISSIDDAKWRAKWEIMNRLGYGERVQVQIAPNYLHEGNDIVYLYDPENSLDGKFKLLSFELPLSPELMTLECIKMKQWISVWEAI